MSAGTGALAACLAGALTTHEAAVRLGIRPADLDLLLARAEAAPATGVPVAVDLAAGRVELLDLAGADWSLPFFDDTVRAARRDSSRVSFTVDVPSLVAAAARGGGRPDGFVFHSGRAGSTLFSQLLAAAVPGTRVLKEPDVLTPVLLLRALGTPGDDAPLNALLHALVALLTARVAGPAPDGPVHLKNVAWATLCGAHLLAAFPETPAVLVVREPAASVASWAHARPSWLPEVAAWPRERQMRLFPGMPSELEGASPVVTLLAHAWRATVEAGLALSADRTLVIDHAELCRAPLRILARTADHLGLALPAGASERATAVAGRYAKDPRGGRYEPHGRHRRPPLPPLVAEAVRAVTGPAWAAASAAAGGRRR